MSRAHHPSDDQGWPAGVARADGSLRRPLGAVRADERTRPERWRGSRRRKPLLQPGEPPKARRPQALTKAGIRPWLARRVGRFPPQAATHQPLPRSVRARATATTTWNASSSTAWRPCRVCGPCVSQAARPTRIASLMKFACSLRISSLVVTSAVTSRLAATTGSTASTSARPTRRQCAFRRAGRATGKPIDCKPRRSRLETSGSSANKRCAFVICSPPPRRPPHGAPHRPLTEIVGQSLIIGDPAASGRRGADEATRSWPWISAGPRRNHRLGVRNEGWPNTWIRG